MGVMIAGMAAVGAASSFMGMQGQKTEAQAQYLANKVETERNNFKNSIANDRKNFQAARQNALRRFNNKQIAKTAVANYGNVLKYNRDAFKANVTNTARSQILAHAGLTAKATGRNLRGGTADLIQQRAAAGFQEQRNKLYREKFAADTNAKNQYKAALDQRDLLSYNSASLYMPGDVGNPPTGPSTLGMLTGMLSGAAGGASQGISMASGLSDLGYKLPSF